ncbi:methyltransferase domain-containing protein [Thermodesulfatator autotrophicus]|uniref:Methyltransferase type 11 domain-containing protein n=1 Tax=Thermodesulfatator autotrophicus TaxID=1795632 RepID=A0A177E9W4_9BACT|nr:methyltransferase domain-containing protein [Thermodesulfatator autotrophicus]OAG27982.1 hypothetical protein TH606_03880 [Thermodesulfatator autotrophicus]
MFKVPPRKLEPEVMLTLEEVRAYDGLVRKYLKILHYGFLETIINFSPEKGLFLDVGTGTGHLSVGLARFCPEVTVFAVDLSENMLKVARENAEKEGVCERIIFLKADAKRLPFRDHTFDCVFCHDMLHHLPDPLDLLLEIKRVAKEDGAILVRDLIRLSPLERKLHVNLFGLTYNELMKKEYEDSIKAALSKEEWLELARLADIPQARVTYQFVTHQSLERPAANRRRVYLELPVPSHLRPATNFYVSKPAQTALPSLKKKQKISPRIKTLIKAAVMAPSGDNLQPWRFHIKSEKEIDFLLDPRVDKSFFNFEQNASIFAVGAAVENASYLLDKENIRYEFVFDYAEEQGLIKLGTLKINWPADNFEFKTFLARTAIMKRHTNRKFYEKANLSEKEIERLSGLAADLPIEVRVLKGEKLALVAELAYYADLIRVERRDLHEFLHETIRWKEQEIFATLDGMPIAALEAGIAGEAFLRMTRPWPVMKAFLRLGVSKQLADYTRKLVLSSEGIIALSAEKYTPHRYFEAGRVAERLWLALTEIGLAVQPMAAAPLFMIRWRKGRFLDFSARHQFFMRKVERGFEKLGLNYPLMLLRFGKAPLPSARALRKEVAEFLVD